MDENNTTPLATEMYADLKQANKFKNILIFALLGVICVLIIALVVCNLYNTHKWSEFDTYVVDSGEGGYANLVQGDNTGGIFNGTDNSENPEDGRLEGDEGQG